MSHGEIRSAHDSSRSWPGWPTPATRSSSKAPATMIRAERITSAPTGWTERCSGWMADFRCLSTTVRQQGLTQEREFRYSIHSRTADENVHYGGESRLSTLLERRKDRSTAGRRCVPVRFPRWQGHAPAYRAAPHSPATPTAQARQFDDPQHTV